MLSTPIMGTLYPLMWWEARKAATLILLCSKEYDGTHIFIIIHLGKLLLKSQASCYYRESHLQSLCWYHESMKIKMYGLQNTVMVIATCWESLLLVACHCIGRHMTLYALCVRGKWIRGLKMLRQSDSNRILLECEPNESIRCDVGGNGLTLWHSHPFYA